MRHTAFRFHKTVIGAIQRSILAFLVAIVFAVRLTSPASAHTALTGSDPAAGTTVQTPPAAVTLTFNEDLVPLNPVIVVVGPDSAEWQTGSPVIAENTVRSEVLPLTLPGEYTVAYRVVSGDGHPVEGEIGFRYEPPATTTSPPLEATSAPAAHIAHRGVVACSALGRQFRRHCLGADGNLSRFVGADSGDAVPGYWFSRRDEHSATRRHD
jgi:methionine-rich copper-binding protein CopC